MEQKNLTLWRVIRLASGFGFTIAIPLVVLLLIGLFLDKHFHTSPIFLLIGLIISFAISFYNIYKFIDPILKNTNKRK